MGKIKQGILGGFSGKVGTVVGGAWKGIDYMRSLATSISNPKSPAQVAVRSNFSTIGKMMSRTNPILKLSDWCMAKKQSAFNAGVRINYKNAIVDNEIDMERLVFGEFSLAQLTNLETVFVADDVELTLKATWTNDANDETSFADDMVAVVVVKMRADGGGLDDVIIDYLNFKREDEQLRIFIGLVESFTPGDKFYAYIGTGRNPRNPREVINIPARNYVKYRATKTI